MFTRFTELPRRILEASSQGDVHSYIIAPAGVYGVGTGPVKRTSVFIKGLAQLFIGNEQPFVIGEGSNTCGWVGQVLFFLDHSNQC